MCLFDREKVLNLLDREVISILPNIIPKFHMMGATAKYGGINFEHTNIWKTKMF